MRCLWGLPCRHPAPWGSPRGRTGNAPGWASVSPKTLPRKKTVNNKADTSILTRTHCPPHRPLVTWEACALEGLSSTWGAGGASPWGCARPGAPSPSPGPLGRIYNFFHGDIWLVSLTPFFFFFLIFHLNASHFGSILSLRFSPSEFFRDSEAASPAPSPGSEANGWPGPRLSFSPATEPQAGSPPAAEDISWPHPPAPAAHQPLGWDRCP